MRELAHILSVLLVVPALALASMFVALGHVASATGFFAFLWALLEAFVVLMPWLLACLALLVALAALGFSRRHRYAAAIGVAGIAIASTAVVIRVGGSPGVSGATASATASVFELGDAAFHLPAIIALVIAVWLAVTEWPAGHHAPPSQP